MAVLPAGVGPDAVTTQTFEHPPGETAPTQVSPGRNDAFATILDAQHIAAVLGYADEDLAEAVRQLESERRFYTAGVVVARAKAIGAARTGAVALPETRSTSLLSAPNRAERRRRERDARRVDRAGRRRR